MTTRSRPRAVVRRALVAVALTSAFTAAPASQTLGAPATGAAHIAVVVFENHEFGDIHGNSCCPYMNSLASGFADFTQFYAISHPSLPNYLAMTGGSTFGVKNDSTKKLVNADNVFNQMQTSGLSWKAYEEDMPSPCFKGDSFAGYVLRHDPAMMYSDISNDPAACQNVVPYSQLATDIGNRALPQFAFITPNLCDDMHDCAPSVGDAWLQANAPALLKALGKTGVLIVTFDEGSTKLGCCGDGSAGGHIYTVVAGPGAATVTISTPLDHYSMLQMIEDNWNLPRLGNAATAPSMTGWQG
jgi:phosphatidylinositol-3-phosphatase